jgi:CRP-like cAMP-binding protein
MADDAQLLRLSRELFLAAAAPPSIPPWAIERMASVLEDLPVEEGQAFFSAGDPPEFIYFMQNGRVRMAGEGRPPLTFEGRWVLGSFDVLLDRPHQRTATALATFRIQRLAADAWLELIEDSFEVARSMLENASRMLAELEEKVGPELVRDAVVPPPFLPLPDGPLNPVERLALFAEIPALRGAGIQTLADLAVLANEVTFEPNDLVWPRGEAPDRAYVVFDGEIEASKESPSVVRRFGPGTLVLGTSSLSAISPVWEGRAHTRSRALSFRLDECIDLMEEHFDMVRSVLSRLAMEREELLDKMARQSDGLVLR